MITKAYLCFSSGNSLLDKVIRLVQRAIEVDEDAPKPMATHAYLIFLSADDQSFGIEARPPKVRSWNLATDPRLEDRHYEVPIPALFLQLLYANAQKHIGQGYHYWGDILAAFYSLTKISIYDAEKIEFFCSQLCVNLLRGIGMDILGKLPDSVITPASLELWAMERLPRRIEELKLATGNHIQEEEEEEEEVGLV